MDKYFDKLDGLDYQPSVSVMYETAERQDLFVTPFDETLGVCKIGERLIDSNGGKYGRILVVTRKQLESLQKQIASILETNKALDFSEYME